MPSGIGSGISIERTRNHVAGSVWANGANSWRPVVRKTRRAPVWRRVAAAASRSGTTVHRSPGSGAHSGLSTRRRGTSADRQATTAWWGMWAVNGWVASMTAAMWLSAIQRANPCGPPNPPTRTSPAGMESAFTLPANEEVTATLGHAAKRAASSDASLDPASSKILGTSRGSGSAVTARA